MRIWRFLGRGLTIAFLGLSLSACAVTQSVQEDLYFPLDRDNWRVANQKNLPGLYRLIEFLRESDSLPDWTEMVAIQTFAVEPKKPLQEDLTVLKEAREKLCPGRTEWSVLHETKTTLTYEARATKSCRYAVAQHEIGKILHGAKSRIIVTYAKRTVPMSEQERAVWYALLRQTKITPRVSSALQLRRMVGTVGTLAPFVILPHAQ